MVPRCKTVHHQRSIHVSHMWSGHTENGVYNRELLHQKTGCVRCVTSFRSLWSTSTSLTTCGVQHCNCKPTVALLCWLQGEESTLGLTLPARRQHSVITVRGFRGALHPWCLSDELGDTIFFSVSNRMWPERESLVFRGWCEYMQDQTDTGRICNPLTVREESFWSWCWTGSKMHTMLP